ncbi:MAG: HD domain-containing protein [Chloroflexi bacterium]|nr:HD domain-containing protein [Chloroflexota bacterium]
MAFTHRFEDALVLAHQLHTKQKRKGTAIPYVGHLLAVCSIVIENGGTEDEAIAALLHDAIEDAGGDRIRRVIRERFGENVLAIVEGCTDTDQTPKPPWRKRKEDYIAHVRHASSSVRLVLMADKLHNDRAILQDYRTHGEAVWRRFNGGQDGSLWYYRSLVKVFRERGSSPLLDELDRVVSELETLVHA